MLCLRYGEGRLIDGHDGCPLIAELSLLLEFISKRFEQYFSSLISRFYLIYSMLKFSRCRMFTRICTRIHLSFIH